jgi:hypothetical protein
MMLELKCLATLIAFKFPQVRTIIVITHVTMQFCNVLKWL